VNSLGKDVQDPHCLPPKTTLPFKLKKPVTMRLSEEVVLYFKEMALEAGVPYQSLINLYLRDCVAQHRKVKIAWQSKP